MGKKSVTVPTLHTTPMPSWLNGYMVLDAHRVIQRPGYLPSFVVLCARVNQDGQIEEFATWEAWDNGTGEEVEWACELGHYFRVSDDSETEILARADYAGRIGTRNLVAE